jgi:hypothetical protein
MAMAMAAAVVGSSFSFLFSVCFYFFLVMEVLMV